MLMVAAAVVSLTLTTSGLILDPETSSIDPPGDAQQIAYRVAADTSNTGPDKLLGVQPEEHPLAPEGPHSVRTIDQSPTRAGGAQSNEGAPLEERPNRAVGQERQQDEAQLKQTMEQWKQRVSGYQKRAKASGNDDMKHQAHMLGREYIIVANQYNKLRQTRGDDWKQERANLDAALNKLQEQWQKAQDTTADSSQ